MLNKHPNYIASLSIYIYSLSPKCIHKHAHYLQSGHFSSVFQYCYYLILNQSIQRQSIKVS